MTTPSNTSNGRRPLIQDPHDISSLLFMDGSSKNYSSDDSLSYVGPVEVAFLPASKSRQRGLFATRDIRAGELLFVTPPTLEASVAKVTQRWNKERPNNNGDNENPARMFLEECSETVLVEAMEEVLELDDPQNRAVAASFTCLMGASSQSQDNDIALPSLDRLNAIRNNDKSPTPPSPPKLSRNDILQIIRQNAFGPDGLHSYTNMEHALVSSSACPPPRLLGLYPLAAMINHSCLANAIRIFCGAQHNLMVVHALTNLSKGDEIVWGYIPPTQPFSQRQETLMQHYQFQCTCQRCETEENEVFGKDPAHEMVQQLLAKDPHLDPQRPGDTTTTNVTHAIRILEYEVLNKKFLSNTVKGYLRISYLPLYTTHLNSSKSYTTEERAGFLPMMMNLHLCCATGHYASTEHLSILHWCYQTVGQMHSASPDPSKTLSKVRFWTEQLKRAHMVRYGALGNELDHVRRVMKETREILMGTSEQPSATPSLLL